MDDEEEVCWIIEHILRGNGLICEKALNGHEAIALIQRQPFRMAFLDAMLLDLDGFEVARQIRERDPSLPIIMISGHFYHEDAIIQGARDSGLISAFISKPFEHQEILRVIELHGSR